MHSLLYEIKVNMLSNKGFVIIQRYAGFEMEQSREGYQAPSETIIVTEQEPMQGAQNRAIYGKSLPQSI